MIHNLQIKMPKHKSRSETGLLNTLQGIFMVDKFNGKDSIKPVYRSPESGKEPKGIKAVSALVQPPSTANPCNPNSCEHMCIVTSAESSGGLGFRDDGNWNFSAWNYFMVVV